MFVHLISISTLKFVPELMTVFLGCIAGLWLSAEQFRNHQVSVSHHCSFYPPGDPSVTAPAPQVDVIQIWMQHIIQLSFCPRRENVRKLKDVSFHKPENCCCTATCGLKCCMSDHTPWYHSSCQWQNSCCDITYWDITSTYSIYECGAYREQCSTRFLPIDFCVNFWLLSFCP